MEVLLNLSNDRNLLLYECDCLVEIIHNVTQKGRPKLQYLFHTFLENNKGKIAQAAACSIITYRSATGCMLTQKKGKLS